MQVWMSGCDWPHEVQAVEEPGQEEEKIASSASIVEAAWELGVSAAGLKGILWNVMSYIMDSSINTGLC